MKAVRGKRANMKDPDFEDPNTFKDPIDKKFYLSLNVASKRTWTQTMLAHT